MADKEEEEVTSSTQGNPGLSIQDILSHLPGAPAKHQYQREGVDPEKLNRKHEKLEEDEK